MIQSTKQRRFDGLFADILILVGIALIGYGLSLWRLDVALTVVGVILLILGVLMSMKPPLEESQRDI